MLRSTTSNMWWLQVLSQNNSVATQHSSDEPSRAGMIQRVRARLKNAFTPCIVMSQGSAGVYIGSQVGSHSDALSTFRHNSAVSPFAPRCTVSLENHGYRMHERGTALSAS